MKRVQMIIDDIRSRRNLEVYITIFLAIVVAVLSVLSIADQAIVSGAVLATLALVVSGILESRRDNDELRKTVADLKTALSLNSEQFLRAEHFGSSKQFQMKLYRTEMK